MKVAIIFYRKKDIGPRQEIGGPDPQLSGLVGRVSFRSAINQLPRRYREIFLLNDVGGDEHSGIAKILGSSIGNLKRQLHRARRLLRELLQGNTSSIRIC